MTHWRRIKCLPLLLLLLCCCGPRLHAQEVSVEELLHRPDDSSTPRNSAAPGATDWNGYVKKGDYGYRDSLEQQPAPEKKPEPKKEEEGFMSSLLSWLGGLFSGPAGIVLVILLVLGLVVYLVYKIVGPGGMTRRRGVAPLGPAAKTVDGEDLSLDWETRMRRAEEAGDLRLAVRCGYMRYLQLLQEAGEIRHRQDKTNADYYREIGDEGLKEAFRSMSRLYEFSWYGQYTPSDAAYARFRQTLTSTKSRLQPA